ncbi:casein kinase II beta subunit CKB1 [Paecilomyces variotii]|uniref:Casein kinase II subunit beta n=1 Tax=Byssochlamys spectabilis TaxID=264951 RepID=A0A443HZU8_BYSSP|nr:casein kinase II beta subunit CKB1 [Paecilomyces variotii]RWQ97303.1 casein kinase II beta subunit CKB1 [Paecilomyces variotii]
MSSSEGAPESWIPSFCSLIGHEYFAEVSEDFIEDDFNLTGLQSQVPMYKEALEMILDKPLGYRRAGDRRHMRVASDLSVIESSAELLYGLIHQRYITSRPGIQQMLEKYEMQHFGVCPRAFCNGCKVLPVGRTDTPGQDTVKLFCPSCQDIYTPPNSRFQSVDGAFFGTTFGCLFFMTFPDLDIGPPNQPTQINGMLTSNLAPGLGRGKVYEPRIYGFRVSERAKSGPRMKWLRMKPDDINELNEAAIYHATHADEEGGDDGDTEMSTVGATAQQAAINRRKKAPLRRRRPAASSNVGQMSLNGGEAG